MVAHPTPRLISFTGSVAFTTTVKLGLTFGVLLTPNLSPSDAAFVRLNQLDGSISVSASNLTFGASIGILGAKVTGGSLTLNAEASASFAGASGTTNRNNP